MATQPISTPVPSSSSARTQMSLTRSYNDAVHTYRVKHARTFQYYPGAVDADMGAIDKAAALFIAGVKALAEAVDGTDLINGSTDIAGCIAGTLEGFVEALPNESATYAYVDAVCSLIASEPAIPAVQRAA